MLSYADLVEEPDRPDPDRLLAAISRSEKTARRGELKIFFGMCPGVGKTYAMLQAARQKQLEGVEVLVGYVETHGRKETLALIEGLPVAPRTSIEYRGTILEEMDLEPILTWHPKIVLVDELAHTNVPGSRHPKRFQDVLELLDAGIDVYTTLNVQHIESRKDTVRQITGVEIRETVPDSILDLANEITLIDLTPSQLRARLAEGKVYLGDRAQTAAANFFRESNLLALREMALRLTAEHVDRDLRTARPAGTKEPWKAGDRLLVAVGPSPSSAKLVRWARRMASSLEASWVAVSVETPHILDAAQEARLIGNLTLARELGAEVIVTKGVSLGPAILRVADQQNVSQIILGKPGAKGFLNRFRPSQVDWLVANSGDIDVQLVRVDRSRPRKTFPSPSVRLGDYAVVLAVSGLITLAGFLLEPVIGYRTIAMLYLLGVLFAALRVGRWASLLLAALSATLWDYLFIPPHFTFYVSHPEDFAMLGMFFLTALIIGQLTGRLREREQMERGSVESTTALFRLARTLSGCDGVDEIAAKSVERIRETFGVESALILCDNTGNYEYHAHPASGFHLNDKEESVAAWTFLKRQAAGRFTETLPDAEAFYLPLISKDRAFGVLAISLSQAPSFQKRELLEAFATQIALVLEKESLNRENRHAALTAQSDKLQKALFDSVSHELKTPLAAIIAAVDQLPDLPVVREIRTAVVRLSRVVGHLLDMTRLDSGLMRLSLEWCDAAEVAREAVAEVKGISRSHLIAVQEAPELQPLHVDTNLIRQVLVTLLSNALTYSPASSRVVLTVQNQGTMVLFTVEDEGPGIPAGEEEKIFEKFYRLKGSPAGGIGLGLSVARRLVEAHGGKITAINRSEGGARFLVSIPTGGEMKLPKEAEA